MTAAGSGTTERADFFVDDDDDSSLFLAAAAAALEGVSGGEEPAAADCDFVSKRRRVGAPDTQAVADLLFVTQPGELTPRVVVDSVDVDNMPLLRYARYLQMRWVQTVVARWLANRTEFNGFLMTGEAGCGKSATLNTLRDCFKRLGLQNTLGLSATTHVATEIIGDGAVTYQSLLGMNFPACRAPNITAFVHEYRKRWGVALDYWRNNMTCPVRAATVCKTYLHGHASFDTRCDRCVVACQKHAFSGVINKGAPAVAWLPFVVVDEYGMLSSVDASKLVWVLDAFEMAGQPKALMLSGSVSQLCSAGEGSVWENGLLIKLMGNRMSLLINHRQHTDVGYGRALSMMQFNLVTGEAARIFSDRVVGEIMASDPNVLPGVTRIYNCNARKSSFNERCSRGGLGVKYTLSARFYREVGCRTSFRDFYKELRAAFPKVFIDYELPLARGEGEVYLCTLAEGTRLAAKVPGAPRRQAVLLHSPNVREVLETTEGPVRRIRHETAGQSVTFFPVHGVAAINTYCAQGATLEAGVVYCPPAQYHRSPIKASAYVAMSRVCTRNKLWLSRNPFDRPGHFAFFSEKMLRYRRAVELGYREVPTGGGD